MSGNHFVEQPVDPPRSTAEAGSGYFYDPSFDHPDAEQSLWQAPPAATARARRTPPPGLPSYYSYLWTIALLDSKQEQFYFRRLNFLKHRVAQWTSRLQRDSDNASLVEQIEAAERDIDECRHVLIESNLRLVVSLAKRYADPSMEGFEELVSVGNTALVRAVDLFDFRRGFRFSTYVYRSVQRCLQGHLRQEKRFRTRFVDDGDGITEHLVGDAAQSDRALQAADDARRSARRALQSLSDRDRKIVMARFGIDGDAKRQSYAKIGKEIGLSTTRVVQLFHRSMSTLRDAMS